MFNARTFIPLSPALAAETVARVGGSLPCTWQPGIAHSTVSFPICRGVMR